MLHSVRKIKNKELSGMSFTDIERFMEVMNRRIKFLEDRCAHAKNLGHHAEVSSLEAQIETVKKLSNTFTDYYRYPTPIKEEVTEYMGFIIEIEGYKSDCFSTGERWVFRAYAKGNDDDTVGFVEREDEADGLEDIKVLLSYHAEFEKAPKPWLVSDDEEYDWED